jgi:hypothetical protein
MKSRLFFAVRIVKTLHNSYAWMHKKSQTHVSGDCPDKLNYFHEALGGVGDCVFVIG